MIDFSCCEVGKAVRALYSENEVLSINPIIKSKDDPFYNDGKTVYYGSFHNPRNDIGLQYRDLPILETGVDVLFNNVSNPTYDTFSGYKISLKNALGSLDNRTLKVVYNTDNLGGYSSGFIDQIKYGETNQALDAVPLVDGQFVDKKYLGQSLFVFAPTEINLMIMGGSQTANLEVTPAEMALVADKTGDDYVLTIWLFDGVS
ncbi:MAG: hypothetical protein CMH44_04270 [Muricauda sp.]|nr:hypothetical protein [Allomuricauda sp.]|tara:strand:+ start:145 stop:753 length:609 start_codon:yes stop_codon:yes gene_type:complete